MAANSRYSELPASLQHGRASRGSRDHAAGLHLSSYNAQYYDPVASQSGDIVDHTRHHLQPLGSSDSMKSFNVIDDEGSGTNQSGFGNHGYQDHEYQEVYVRDRVLKDRIRTLRVVSRVIATILSIGVLVPITITLIKFLQTKNVYREAPTPDGGTILRTAWALETKIWPTYMYFSIAAISVLLHTVVLLGYVCSIQKANTADAVSSGFEALVLIGNLVVWIVAVTIYKREKEATAAGKHNDLWGWTCSDSAQAIQSVFKDVVPFNTYCTVQSASWYIGLGQAGSLVLTCVLYVFMWARRGSKRAVRTSMDKSLLVSEPFRQ